MPNLKSLEGVKTTYRAIFRDCYAATGVDCTRDLVRIIRLLETRGLRVLTLEFPAICKAFDKGLADGVINLSGLLKSKTRKGRMPVFLQGLFSHVFDKRGYLLDDPCVDSIFFIRQVFLTYKKFQMEYSHVQLEETLRDFYQTDIDLPIPPSWWDEVNPSVTDIDVSLDDYINVDAVGYRPHVRARQYQIQSVFDRLSVTLGNVNFHEHVGRHGPGATSEFKRHSVFKYDYRITSWPQRLNVHFPVDLHTIPNLDWLEDLPSDDYELPSRMVAVPKTHKGPRLIACEPLALQYCQQMVWSHLEEMVGSSFLSNVIRFRSQDQNRKLALEGSREGRLSTIDLSKASDSVTPMLVSCLVRKNEALHSALIATRCKYVQQDLVDSLPLVHKLRKFSTMGSACTFPVQAILFACIAIGTILHEKGLPTSSRNLKIASKDVSVFGDDIIVPTEHVDAVCDALFVNGFSVNTEKSFTTGLFRESCGIDAYSGVDITPWYVTSQISGSAPEAVVRSIALLNNAFVRGLWHTSIELEKYLPSKVRLQQYIGEGGLALYSSSPMVETRFNPHLHRQEQKTLVPYTKKREHRVEGIACFNQYIVESPDPLTQWSSGYSSDHRTKYKVGWRESSRDTRIVKQGA